MDTLAEPTSNLQSARARLQADLRAQALVIGEVTLTSGRKAQYYVDAKRAILLPDTFAAIGALVADRARAWEASAVGGVPVSAIPVACAALAAGIRRRSSCAKSARSTACNAGSRVPSLPQASAV